MAKRTQIILCAAAVVPLVCICVFSPVLAIPVMPIIVFIICLLPSAVGVWTVAVGAAAACSLFAASVALWGFNPFSTASVAVIAAATVTAVTARKLKPIPFVCVVAFGCTVAVASVLCVWALCTDCSVSGVITGAYGKFTADPTVAYISARKYRNASAAQLSHEPYAPSDELYLADAVRYYATLIGAELDGTTAWYVIGYGEFCGGSGALLYLAAAERGKSRQLRLGRRYFKYVVLPVLAFSLLALYRPAAAAVITVVNSAVMLPSCVNGITLLHYIASLPEGKIKAVPLAAFWIVAALLLPFYEWGMLIYGFIGLADSVLDVRKLLDWALY